MSFHRYLFCPTLIQPRQWSVLTIQRRLDSWTTTGFVLWTLHCHSDKKGWVWERPVKCIQIHSFHREQLEHDVSVGALLKFGWQVRIKLIWYKPKQRFWTDVWSSHRLTSWYPYKAVFPLSGIRILSLPSLTMFDSWMWVIHWHWFKSTDFGVWEEWAALEQRNLKNRWSPPEDSTALLALEAAGYQDMHECKPKLKHDSST